MGSERKPGNPPDSIWLQWHGDGESGESPHDPAEVTWSETKEFRHDVEYLRVDPADDPCVLRRALELLITSGGDRLPYDSERQIIEQYIEQAIRELESEGRDGEQGA